MFGLYKYSPVNENPINDAEKREKNIKEGQGIKIGGGPDQENLNSHLLMKCGELQYKF